MPSKELKIRKSEESDYLDIARSENAVFTERKRDEEFFRQIDKNKAEKCKHQRYVAEIDDKVVGHGFYTQLEWSYSPGKYFIYVCIHPDFQEQGYGSEVYRYLMDELKEKDPKKLEAHTREDKQNGIQFLEDRGFKETQREWELVLNVDDFDFEEFRGLEKRLNENHGIRLKSVDEMRFDEGAKKELHELFEEITNDVPRPGEHTRIDFDQFISFFERPDFLPEAYIIAVKDDEFIGFTSHLKRGEEEVLYTCLTGVKREYRGNGIATALKIKAIEVAEDEGFSKMTTENETNNEAMLHINQKLGFEKKPAWIDFEKVLQK
ncbi:MAG: GNAT family N-acetyltransferase [Candidatus Natronoplasma sp.]